MAPTLVVRNAREQDVPALADFNIAMAQETENKSLSPAKVKAGMRAVLRHPDHGFYLVAELNGQVAGSLLVTREWSDWRNGVFWWIQSVYVPPGFRKRGIYRALYDGVKARAESNPEVCGFRLYVAKSNRAAMSVYSKLGMSETEYRIYEESLWE
ncbi:MAG: GNAT family N-acetyltransferase [Deltaproteobacteria bacterium]|jgi:ribosomal protein S18 acetylase RimI-like enzyme|nr:GNAT family N-acetyltransferase [Deltaproteobacteria bacterium]NTV55818.1 GNAT family N-acetyltransferase [Deltaproteobacteria bacterium]